MKLIDRIEFWHNKASDTKFVWFPFQFLKPEPQTKIGYKLKFKMTLCFGFYYGIFAAIRSLIFSRVDFGTALSQDITIAILFFAIWFNLITAPFWNRRATRIEKQVNS